MNPEQDMEAWHAEQRRRDAEDIASGRRTPEQVNRDNGIIPNPAEWVPLNLIEASLAIKKHRKKYR